MTRKQRRGRVDNIEIIYNNEYRMRSSVLNFDFKAGLASTSSPVEIKSPKLTLRGTGLTARAKDELLRIERNVNGSVETGKGGLRFEADRLTYRLKENLYELEGRVRMTGEQLTVTCDTLYLYGTGERTRATGGQGQGAADLEKSDGPRRKCSILFQRRWGNRRTAGKTITQAERNETACAVGHTE